MTKTFEIKNFNITFVFRHKWDNVMSNFMTFREYRLGGFFKRDKAIAKATFNNPKEWKFVPTYMVGVDLLVAKCFVKFDWGVMRLKE